MPKTGTLTSDFVYWFARQQATSSIELLQVWAGDDLLDAHRLVLDRARQAFLDAVTGVIGAIEANRSELDTD